ncbi:MAG: carbohydrate ABC transporter permease [Rhodobacteraceae bacterium]|nr:carbohydrate ABC transporter permease [Paracoccaceae bacterium]
MSGFQSLSAHATLADRLYSAMQAVHWRNTGVLIILLIGAIFMLLPFLWMFSASMRPAAEAYQLPPSFFPKRINLESYRELLNSPVPFLRMYWNSLVVASVTTVVVIFTSAMAAFAFSRLRMPGSNTLFVVLLAGLMVPPAMLIIPLFFGIAWAGLHNTLWAIIVPGLANPLAILMMRSFMQSQSRAYEEAAFIDGASYWTIFWRISLPQMGPPIAALAIIVFTTSWNNFLLPLVFARSPEVMTLPIGMIAISNVTMGVELSVLMSAVTLALLPLTIVFIVAQRFIVESIASTGIKG